MLGKLISIINYNLQYKYLSRPNAASNVIRIRCQHRWVARTTRKSLRLILSRLCACARRNVRKNVLHSSWCLHQVILNIRRDDWLIDVIRNHSDSLPPCGCSRPSTLRSIIRIITISSAHTSASNLT
ncbi:hypothetical protein HKD37_06G016592 [Glycine soja]